MNLTYFTETLYHYACSQCDRKWSVVNNSPSEIRFCPHCGQHVDDRQNLENKQKIDWYGGNSPVPDGLKLRLYLRSGLNIELDSDDPTLNWKHENCDRDIIAFQILELIGNNKCTNY